MQTDSRPLGLRGLLIDSPEFGRLRAVRDGAVLIEEGRIAAVDDHAALNAARRDIRWMHSPESVIIPGLVDVRTHLPQFPAVGRTANGFLPWLHEHILPLEKQFRPATARREARAFFDDLARHGTTCASVFGAAFADSTEEAFRAAEESGLRVTLGKMMMDADSCERTPAGKWLEKNCSESEALCRRWHGRDGGRIEYAFSPRSAPFCSEDLMRRAAELAEAHGTLLQTQFAAHPEEVAAVSQRFAGVHGAEVYSRCRLLQARTLLGHCVQVSDEEIALLAEAGVAVAHCPTADLFLAGGLMALDRLRAAGLRVGLGSGVAWGPELNMWQVMRSAVETQTARHCHERTIPRLTATEAFFLATQGGADALGKGGLLGSLEIGKDADLVVLDLASVTPYGRKLNPHAHLAAEDVISLLVHRGGSTSIVETYVRGRSIHRAPAPLLV